MQREPWGPEFGDAAVGRQEIHSRYMVLRDAAWRRSGAIEEGTVMALVRMVALVFGIVFVLAGIAGFIPGVTHEMSPVQGMDVATGAVLGLVPVNAVANVVHLAIGVIMIVASRSYSMALNTVRFFGVAYALLSVIGLVAPEGFGILPLGGVELAIHILTAVVLLVVGFVMPGEERDARAPA